VKQVHAIVLLAVMLAGCRLSILDPAMAGARRMTRTELFFGRSISGGGSISDHDWQAFVEDTIAPRFPAGFSVVDALGQYREESGTITHEQSKIVVLFHDRGVESIDKLDEIRAEYKKRFHQESVIRESSEVWVSF
jgi:hypothetical protein